MYAMRAAHLMDAMQAGHLMDTMQAAHLMDGRRMIPAVPWCSTYIVVDVPDTDTTWSDVAKEGAWLHALPDYTMVQYGTKDYPTIQGFR